MKKYIGKKQSFKQVFLPPEGANDASLSQLAPPQNDDQDKQVKPFRSCEKYQIGMRDLNHYMLASMFNPKQASCCVASAFHNLNTNEHIRHK